MTIDDTVRFTAAALALLGLLLVWLGWRELTLAGRLSYFLIRRQRSVQGWRLILAGIGLAGMGGAVQLAARPLVYRVFPPTPSVTPTNTPTGIPSPTLSPTVSLTPTISATPTITPTGTITATPRLPDAVAVLLIHEAITPHPLAAFSPVLVASHITSGLAPIDPADAFQNPLGTLFGTFTYNFLQDGVRWTALWYLETEVVCLETQVWTHGTGGFGYTECLPEGGWRPGSYEVQVFFADRWLSSGRFRVSGEPPTATAAPSVTTSATVPALSTP